MNILLLIVVYRIVYIEREGLGRQAGRGFREIFFSVDNLHLLIGMPFFVLCRKKKILLMRQGYSLCWRGAPCSETVWKTSTLQ